MGSQSRSRLVLQFYIFLLSLSGLVASLPAASSHSAVESSPDGLQKTESHALLAQRHRTDDSGLRVRRYYNIDARPLEQPQVSEITKTVMHGILDGW